MKLNFDTLLFRQVENGTLTLMYSCVSEAIANSILSQLNDFVSQLEQKKELMVPFLDYQSYVFFYKVTLVDKYYIFCIVTKSDYHNFFFNEIPFLKLKAQQFLYLVEELNFDTLKNELKNWFNPYTGENDIKLNDYSNLFKNTKDIENVIYSMLTSKNLFLISEDSAKIDSIMPLLIYLSPHRYLRTNYITDSYDFKDYYPLLTSNKKLKVTDEFIELNLDKHSFNFKHHNSALVNKIFKTLSNSPSTNQNMLKTEFRSIITETLDLLELFQSSSDDINKTKSIESIRTNLGTENFQILLELAQSINKNIENQVATFTKLEKKYSSFLSDF